jgi:hypothetical protein
MKLHEYQSKQIFSKYGIPIPRGRVASSADEARHIAEELGGRVVIKSQVLVGGRGKAGGIRLAKSPKEAGDLATTVLGMEIKGLPVRKILIDEAVGITKEIYLGITNDRAARRPVMMASSAGGVDIEEVAATTPEKIIKIHIDPLLGLRDYQARDLAVSIDLPRENWRAFGEIATVSGGLIMKMMRHWQKSIRWLSPLTSVCWHLMGRWSSMTTPCSATATSMRCVTWARKIRLRWKHANMASRILAWKEMSAAWSTGLGWRWPQWISSNYAAASRPTSWILGGEPVPKGRGGAAHHSCGPQGEGRAF